jgi:hypothetical protein
VSAAAPFAGTYGVEILFEAAPVFRKGALLRNIRRWCPRAAPIDGNPEDGSLLFVHPDHPIQLADAHIEAQTFVAVGEGSPDQAKYGDSVRQSWDFGEAATVVDRARATVLVTDFMTSNLEYRERLDLFQRSLRGVLETAPGVAIHWPHAGRIVAPRTWVHEFDSGDLARRFFAGAINVRMFNVQSSSRGGPDDVVMDTLGLAALGLPDLQCHFRDLDRGSVARLLYNTAWYVFTNGDLIADGQTVEGLAPGSRWRCQHEEALVPPARGVLDLNPGPPHAAGRRDR